MVMITSHPAAELSLKETAALAGAPEKTIRHELEARVVRARRVRGRRRFHPREVVYFVLVNELPITLSKTLRKDLFDLLAANKARVGRWRRDEHGLVLEGHVPVLLSTDDVVRRVNERVDAFVRGRARVASRPDVLGGEPVFEGTRIPVRFVGERARNGEPVADLLQEYPALAAEDIEFAEMYLALGRAPGRPRKRLKFVRGDG